MFVNDVTPRITYTATAAQTLFAVPFEFLLDADLTVLLNGTTATLAASPTLVTEYSVVGAGVEGGGSVNLGAGASSGDEVTIFRAMPFELQTVFPLGGPFLVTALNDELARYMLLMKQLDDSSDRALRTPLSDEAGELLLPPSALRAGKLLSFDNAGDPTVTTTVPSALDDAFKSITSLKAADISLGSVLLLSGNDSGVFTWTVGNYTAEVAADPTNLKYIKSDD